MVGVVSSDILYKINDEEYILDITLEIHSRFDVVNNKIASPFFLTTMLKKGRELKTTGNDIKENPNDYFFDFLLVFKFATVLKEAYEKGYYRTYQKFQRNDDRLKGTIDIARYIKENMGMNNGKISYSHKEKTINNYLNHLLLETYDYIREKYENLFYSILDSDEIISKLIHNLRYEINYPMYSKKEILSKNVNSITHPFYTEYEQLREVCFKIMRDEGTSIFDGNDYEVEGILYYIPDLWEEFLQYYLEDSTEYYLTSQCEIMIFDFDDDHKYMQETKPDFVFFSDLDRKNPYMILDAKFIPAWAELIRDKKWNKKLAKDYNKCIRDMNSINAHATGIICPINDEFDEKTVVHNISKYNTKDKFYTFGISVPIIQSDDRYEIWENKFYDNFNKTINLIKDIIVKNIPK